MPPFGPRGGARGRRQDDGRPTALEFAASAAPGRGPSAREREATMAGGGILHAREMTGDPNFRVDVGSVLARTLSVWGRNLVPFCLVGLVVYSPVLLGLGAIAASGTSMPLG